MLNILMEKYWCQFRQIWQRLRAFWELRCLWLKWVSKLASNNLPKHVLHTYWKRQSSRVQNCKIFQKNLITIATFYLSNFGKTKTKGKVSALSDSRFGRLVKTCNKYLQSSIWSMHQSTLQKATTDGTQHGLVTRWLSQRLNSPPWPQPGIRTSFCPKVLTFISLIFWRTQNFQFFKFYI